jgi:DNA-directed RNA polymerase omega subunit
MSITVEQLKPVVEKTESQVHVDSIYRLIILAGLRSKQLVRGSQPRIEADPSRRKNTSIALEEIRQGLVYFTIIKKPAIPEGAVVPNLL